MDPDDSGHSPSVIFREHELEENPAICRSAEFNIIMLVPSGLLGIVRFIAAIIAGFFRQGAGPTWLKAGRGGAGFVLFLAVLSDQFILRYPNGLLQSFVTLPWPLQ